MSDNMDIRSGALTDPQREALIHSLLGKTVDVIIDRPIGHIHVTNGITLHYTVNYGYLPGVLGGDGEEQDVYILGVSEPLERFRGRIIGAIRREDDNEDKLVAAPEGIVFHQGEIAQAVRFVEKYFMSTIDSLFRKSCGVIPFRRNGGKIQLLLLFQRRNQTWSFPKGHMDAGESEQETALREIKEETGLSAALLPDFRATVEYHISPLVRKQVVLFLGQVAGEPTVEEREIETYRWVSFDDARTLLLKKYHPLLAQAEAKLTGKGTAQ